MFRKHVPDLDMLDSPLMSANPFGSTLGVVPGSALAERIFNDPESWQDTGDDDDGDLAENKEAMTWLAEEVERYHTNGDQLGLSPVGRDVDIMLKPYFERFNLVATPGLENQVKWEGVVQEDKPPLLPLFEHKALDLNFDLRLSKIWDAKGKMFGSASSPLSPANERSAKTKSNLPTTTDRARLAAPPALDLAVESSLSPIISPVAVASASTTWSILEWYGAPPTPRMSGRVPLLGHYPPTPFQPIPPVPHSSLRTPSSPSANATVVSQPPPLPPLPKPLRNATPPVPEGTLRRLPVIPDPARTTPSPKPTPTLTPPRIKSPERTPRGSATLPPPSSSGSDPFYLSPHVTPIRSGTLPSRSPPAGPRPRSGTGAHTPRRQACGRASPTPITIAPAPAPVRPGRPTPPPTLRLGVPA